MSVSRRHLLLAAPLDLAAIGLSAPAIAAPTAPAQPASGDTTVWTDAFMRRSETHEGFAVEDMHQWQVENARFIIAVAKGHGISAHGTQIILATAIVEAWLFNYEPAVDLDSGGLFQQRPSMGWGSAREVRHKKLAIEGFLGLGDHSSAPGLLDVAPVYDRWDLGAAAQAVQGSAFPDRYAEQAGAARTIWERYADGVAPFTG